MGILFFQNLYEMDMFLTQEPAVTATTGSSHDNNGNIDNPIEHQEENSATKGDGESTATTQQVITIYFEGKHQNYFQSKSIALNKPNFLV